MDAASRGAAALESKDYNAAIQHYTTAISQSPQAVDYYIKRSAAHTRSSPSQPALALQDAEVAVKLAHKRQKRELIGQAQLRRAIALYGLEQYEDSKKCFEWATKFAPKEAQLGIWEKKLETRHATGEGAEVKEIPEVDLERLGKENTKRKDGAAEKDGSQAADTTKPSPSTTQAEPTLTAVQTPPSKIRHDWYQNTTTVTVTLMAKGIPKDKAQVDIQPQSLSLSFPLPTGSDYDFSLDPLFGAIDPAASTHRILGTKAEFVLEKSLPGQKWASLEGTPKVPAPGADGADGDDSVQKAVLGHAAAPVVKETGPAYPTSSRTGPKNWDKISQDLTAKKPAAKSPTTKRASSQASSASSSSSRSSSPNPSKPSASSSSSSSKKKKNTAATAAATATATATAAATKNDEEDELERYNSSEDEAGADPVNGFFKKLFRNADPDTQRAMMKSYQESNGTALSTNWSEVGKGKVETTPPDGMVARKWAD